MKPYYDKHGITLYCADNRDVDLPVADFILTDPPFTDATHSGARTNPDWGKSGGNTPGDLGIAFDAFTTTELEEVFARLAPLTRRWLVSFLDYKHTVHLEAHPPEGLRFVRFGVWVKPNSAPQFTGDRPGPGWESLAILHKAGGRMTWNGGGKHGVWTHNIAHHNHRISDHPNAKPLPLLAELIADFSQLGDCILDPFAGSGAVLAAAYLKGRRAVGVERNERHCAAFAFWMEHGRPERLPAQSIPGGGLFDGVAL
jgi:site-specific DNA-methyltransferase (adenine-specific)